MRFLVGTTSSNTISVTVNTISTATLLGTASSGVSTSALALTAITGINSAINTITQTRAKVGAYELQFMFSGQDIATNVQNTQAAVSTVLDADVAQVKAELSSQDVLTQSAVAALAQAAQLPQELLKLIQS